MPLVPPPPPPPPHKAQYRSKGKARLIKPVEYLSNSKHTMKKIPGIALVIGASFVCISVSSFRFQFPFPVSISSFHFQFPFHFCFLLFHMPRLKCLSVGDTNVQSLLHQQLLSPAMLSFPVDQVHGGSSTHSTQIDPSLIIC